MQLRCLCKCGCPVKVAYGREDFVCNFCAKLWWSGDGAHRPPAVGVARQIRENEANAI